MERRQDEMTIAYNRVLAMCVRRVHRLYIQSPHTKLNEDLKECVDLIRRRAELGQSFCEFLLTDSSHLHREFFHELRRTLLTPTTNQLRRDKKGRQKRGFLGQEEDSVELELEPRVARPHSKTAAVKRRAGIRKTSAIRAQKQVPTVDAHTLGVDAHTLGVDPHKLRVVVVDCEMIKMGRESFYTHLVRELGAAVSGETAEETETWREETETWRKETETWGKETETWRRYKQKCASLLTTTGATGAQRLLAAKMAYPYPVMLLLINATRILGVTPDDEDVAVASGPGSHSVVYTLADLIHHKSEAEQMFGIFLAVTNPNWHLKLEPKCLSRIPSATTILRTIMTKHEFENFISDDLANYCVELVYQNFSRQPFTPDLLERVKTLCGELIQTGSQRVFHGMDLAVSAQEVMSRFIYTLTHLIGNSLSATQIYQPQDEGKNLLLPSAAIQAASNTSTMHTPNTHSLMHSAARMHTASRVRTQSMLTHTRMHTADDANMGGTPALISTFITPGRSRAYTDEPMVGDENHPPTQIVSERQTPDWPDSRPASSQQHTNKRGKGAIGEDFATQRVYPTRNRRKSAYSRDVHRDHYDSSRGNPAEGALANGAPTKEHPPTPRKSARAVTPRKPARAGKGAETPSNLAKTPGKEAETPSRGDDITLARPSTPMGHTIFHSATPMTYATPARSGTFGKTPRRFGQLRECLQGESFEVSLTQEVAVPAHSYMCVYVHTYVCMAAHSSALYAHCYACLYAHNLMQLRGRCLFWQQLALIDHCILFGFLSLKLGAQKRHITGLDLMANSQPSQLNSADQKLIQSFSPSVCVHKHTHFCMDTPSCFCMHTPVKREDRYV